MNVEILCVGRELLIGKTLNTNAHWLAGQITALGGKVIRVTTVGDEVEEIASSLEEIVNRKPDLVIAVGGLGPTFDDKTLEGVADAIGVRLGINQEALKLVREKYQSLSTHGRLRLTKSRVKMATLPRGAMPLYNPVGTAPGVILKRPRTTLICLPGVPEEMKAIFNESLVNLIEAKVGGAYFYEESFDVADIFESELAPLIDRVMRKYPRVYVKSHARGGEGRAGATLELHFSSASRNMADAKGNVVKAVKMMKRILAERRERLLRNPGSQSHRHNLA